MYKLLLLLTLILFPIFFILSVPHYSGDIKNHLAWGKSILELGTLGFYERDFPGYAFPNYPPVAMASFALSLKLYQLTNSFIWVLNTKIPLFPSSLVHCFQNENVMIAYLKLPALISHFAVAFGLLLLLSKVTKKHLWLWSLLVLNPALLYLTIIWGQIDLLPIAFLIFSLYFLFKESNLASVLFLGLALLSKQTIIIYLPLMLYLYFKKGSLIVAIKNLGYLIVVFYLSYLPFHQFDITWPLKLYRLNFELVAHSINENAFNIWGALFNFKGLSDTEIKLLGISYQNWGYLLFILFMLIPGLTLLRKKVNIKEALRVICITSLVYYLTLTRMHERYLAPALVFLISLSGFGSRYLIGAAFFTVLYLINLYRGLFLPPITLLKDEMVYLQLVKPLVLAYLVAVFYYIYDFIYPD